MMKFILGGTYAEARYFKEKYQSAKDAVILHDHINLIGIHDGQLLLCGTYYNRANIEDILKEAKLHNMEIVKLYG